jgi:hypothetical protein
MVKSNFQSANSLFEILLTDRQVKESQKHLAFIILENHKIPWTWYKEKMAQYLFWNMQGGVTGAGSGHCVYFYNDIDTALKESKANGHTHAMVCTIGMLISGFGNQITVKTPIQNFYEFSESDEFMRAHIIAHPNKPATIHTQHFEINLNKWNGKSITELGHLYERGLDNIHDDYTPIWIDTKIHPRINNFTREERSEKNFMYPHRDYEMHENIFHNFLKTGSITTSLNNYESSTLLIKHAQRKRKRFYYENNEVLPSDLNTKYDVIIAPTAGLIPEFLYDKYGHKDTKVIIFDYDPVFLKVKQHIIECGFVGDDLLRYMDHLSSEYGNSEYIFSCGRTPNQAHAFVGNSDVIQDASRVVDKLAEADYEMKLVNILSDDFEWINELVKDKTVMFYVSNIFKYYITWLYCDTNTIIDQYNKLDKALQSSSSYELYGRSWK